MAAVADDDWWHPRSVDHRLEYLRDIDTGAYRWRVVDGDGNVLVVTHFAHRTRWGAWRAFRRWRRGWRQWW